MRGHLRAPDPYESEAMLPADPLGVRCRGGMDWEERRGWAVDEVSGGL